MAWDSVRDLRAWQQRLERFSHQAEPWAPAIDVYETDDRYVVTAEVPGLSRDQIEVALESSRLTLRGRRADAGHAGDVVRYHLVERGHGAFSRIFEFAETIDVGGVKADLTNGVLTVTLPKAPAGSARRIDVQQG